MKINTPKKAQSKIALVKIDGIELIEKSLRKEAASGDPSEFEFGVNCQFAFNSDTKVVVVFTRVLIKKKGIEMPVGNLIVAVGFYFENYFDFFTADSATTTIPQDISLNLRSAAISTTRGVLFSELRGTGLHEAYLPIIDPAQMAPIK